MDKTHILVVDDDTNLLKSLDFILTAANYDVTTAAHGQAALEQILISKENGRRIDLLITDIRMPGLTGLQLIDELTHHQVKMPIVVLTAYGNSGLVKKLGRKGHVAYIEKTLNEPELVERIGCILRGDVAKMI